MSFAERGEKVVPSYTQRYQQQPLAGQGFSQPTLHMLLWAHQLVDDHQALSETAGAVKLVIFLFIARALCVPLRNE